MKTAPRILWAFDFDGTISELVPDRRTAVIDQQCRELLVDLASDPENLVVVISSREIGDLLTRVKIPGAVIAGGSGLEYQTPDGRRFRPGAGSEERLSRGRARIFPALKTLERKTPGVELEDKYWSAAVHYRYANDEDRRRVIETMGTLRSMRGVPVTYGPESVEVQFLPGVDKSHGLFTIVRSYFAYPPGRRMTYAGDDQGDVEAMRWVLARDGAVFVVGGKVRLPGARYVDHPAQLPAAILAVRDEYKSAGVFGIQRE